MRQCEFERRWSAMVSGLPGNVEGVLQQLRSLYGTGDPAAQQSKMMHDVAATLRGEVRAEGMHGTQYAGHRGAHVTHADTHAGDDDGVHSAVTKTGGGTVTGRNVLTDQLATFREQAKALTAVGGTRFSQAALLNAAHITLGNATRQVHSDTDAVRKHAARIVPTAGVVPNRRHGSRSTRRRYRRRSRRRHRLLHSDGTAGGNAARAASGVLGMPYIWGGGGAHGPSGGGFDCSGLTQYAVAQASHGHVILPRTTYEQIHSGVRIPIQDARAGDLVFPGDSFSRRGPEHVQLCAGHGRVLEAPHSGANVQYSRMPRNAVVIRVL